jgi:hypothetical protein
LALLNGGPRPDLAELAVLPSGRKRQPEARIEKLEAAMATADHRQWMPACVVAPIMVALHAGLRKLGVTI